MTHKFCLLISCSVLLYSNITLEEVPNEDTMKSLLQEGISDKVKSWMEMSFTCGRNADKTLVISCRSTTLEKSYIALQKYPYP